MFGGLPFRARAFASLGEDCERGGQTGFGPGFNGPLQLAVSLPSAGDTGGLARFTTTLRHTPGIASVAAPRLNPARDTAAIAAYPTTSPQSAQTTSLVKRLRSDVLPPLAKATGATVYVGGATATQVDFAHVLSGKLPLFIGMVVLLSALLLLVVFRWADRRLPRLAIEPAAQPVPALDEAA